MSWRAALTSTSSRRSILDMNDGEATIPLRMKDSKPYGVDEKKDKEWRRKQIALSISEKVDILDRLNDAWHFLRSMNKVEKPPSK